MPFLPLDAPARAGAFQLVATIGPASASLAAELAAAGATAFRLNASHLAPPELADALSRLGHDCPGAPVVVDLQGAKMRLGLASPRDVSEADRLRFGEADADVLVPHPELFEQARVGDVLSVDDARVRFEVLRVAAGTLETRALNTGRLLPRKGINLERHPVRLHGLTASDVEACAVAARGAASALAFSFMLDGSESAWLRTAVPGCRVVGKIERHEAVHRLPEIAARVDAVWVCRGDLGAQIGPAALARAVASIEPTHLTVPVLMAGQVLEHLTHHREPTRSEVCHLFDLLARGYAGVVLSDETAVGIDPVHAVATTADLLASLRS
jgi:pyruvate kinase